MKKLFTLAAAILASFSLWAADPAPVDNPATKKYGDITFLDVAGTVANRTDKQEKEYLTYGVYYVAKTKAITTWYNSSDGNPASNHETTGYSITDAADFGFFPTSSTASDINYGGTKCHSGRQRYFYVTGATSVAGIVRDGGTSSNKYAQMLIQTVAEDGTLGSATTIGDTYVANNAGYVLDGGELDPAKYYKISFTSPASSNCYMYQIRLGKTANCTDPELTVSPTEGTGFVGDPINITISSKNNSKPVNAAVTVDGVEGVYGTDYTYSASTGLVQATPLKAGKFEIKFSQATDGTYCAAEETVTFEISAKTPCTSFDIDAPATAHVGEEVTIELKNFDAAPTTIVWYDGELNEITAANGKTSYTFTPAAAGDYAFQVTAWNAYNTYNVDEASNYTIITVTVGTDATLSDLKVNGATIDGFAADKFEYTIAAELGVYEALKVEATAADAPYASAAVVDNGEGKVTITVTAQNESTQEYVVNYNRAEATLLAPISTSTTWDWTKAGGKTDEQKATGTMPSNAEEFNFADVLKSPDAEFNAAALAGIAQFANRDGYFQGNMVKFNTTVPGTVVVTYSNTGSKRPYRHIKVNETMSAEGSATQDQKSSEAINVSAGDVVITFYIPDATSPQEGNNDKVGPSMGRIYKIVFTKSTETAIDNTEAAVKAVKMVENGMLIIKKDGKTYNVLGQTVR